MPADLMGGFRIPRLAQPISFQISTSRRSWSAGRKPLLVDHRPPGPTHFRAKSWSNCRGPGGPPQPPVDGEGGDGDGSSSNGQKDRAVITQDGMLTAEDVIVLDVSGMHCGSCVSKVKRVLEEHPSVSQASVNLATEVALVRVNLPCNSKGATASQEREGHLKDIAVQLMQVLADNGFRCTLRDKSKGNAAAAAIVKARQEERVRWGFAIQIQGPNPEACRMSVKRHTCAPQPESLSQTEASFCNPSTPITTRRMREAGWRVATAWVLASACVLGHLPHWWSAAPHFLHRLAAPHLHAALSAVALLGPGREIIARGWESMWQRRPDMNSLVALGACASFAVSSVAMGLPALGWPTFFEEPAMLLGCVLLGRALEERAKLAATSDLAALQGLVPDKARLEVGMAGEWREVPTEALVAGDVLTVLPGDRVPVDGIVISGASSANEAALTGEPMPVPKGPGTEVTAGTVNVEGRVRVRVRRAGASTTMADILRLVEAAQARTAPIQRLADAVAGRFAVGVMAASTATFAFWAIAGPRLFPQAIASYCGSRGAGAAGSLLLSLQLACNVLVVACPCALGLAAPTAVLVATSAAARRGLLIRGGDVLEEASRVDTVIFDKTGTLTEGHPQVQHIFAASPQLPAQQLLALAAALERESSHPLASAILSAAESASSEQLSVVEGSCRQVPGSGISGRVQGVQVAVGTHEWIRGSLDAGEHSAADRFMEASTSQASGNMQMCISVDGRLAGIVTLADHLRLDAAATVAHLQQQGFSVHMLSGDTEAAAQRVASNVGILASNVHAGVKPSGKAALVQQLQAGGARVAMVGDGINDAGALAAADIGMAMAGGVDAASEVAKIVLLGDRLPQVAEALQISRSTFAKIQQNLCWAFGYNLVGLPVAAGALLPAWGLALTPSISGALMGFSSLAVMANSLTLQLQQPVRLQVAESKVFSTMQAEDKRKDVTAFGVQKYAEKTLV